MPKYELERIRSVNILKTKQKGEERKGIMMSKEYKNYCGNSKTIIYIIKSLNILSLDSEKAKY